MTRNSKIIVLIFCLAKLALHLLADYHSGFQSDELLHIQTGRHLDFGYMEFPPMIGFLAFLQNSIGVDSIFVHHIFPHIASTLILVFVAKTVAELGGKEWAVFLSLLAVLIAPAFGRSQQLFQPVVFSQLFWVLNFYFLLKFVKYSDRKSLFWLTISSVLAFYSKYDAVFFLIGLVALLFFKKTRNALIINNFWWNILLFLICISPNILWQFSHDFPVIKMFRRLGETQLENVSKIQNLEMLFLGINPINSIFLIIPAVLFFKVYKHRNYLPLFLTIAISFFSLLLSNGKAYYFFPIILTMIPFGAYYIENQLFLKNKWFKFAIGAVMLCGIILIPFGMPVYSFSRYLERIYPYEKSQIDGGKFAVKYDEYYSDEKWRTTLKAVDAVYKSLPQFEKNNCGIWAKHYAQAAAINLYNGRFHLLKAFSYHGSFYLWAPRGKMPETIIFLSYDVGDFAKDYFREVRLVKTIYNPYADSREELFQKIYICRKPKYNFDEMKTIFKNRVFE